MPPANRKKILIISLNIPYPLSHGGAIAQYFFLEKICSIHDVTFCSYAFTKYDQECLEELAQKLPELKVVYASKPVIPESAVRKTINLLKQGIRGSREIDPVAGQFEFSPFVFEPVFIEFLSGLMKQSFDIIQVEFFESISLLGIIPPGPKKIFICHEIRNKRISLLKTGANYEAFKTYMAKASAIIENAWLRLADSVVVFSDEDRNYPGISHPDIRVSPFGIPSQMRTGKSPSGQFYRFLIMGNEAHWPNKEGLEWFLNDVYLPHYDKIDWTVYILGDWTDSFRNKYAKHSRIMFTGIVDAVDPYYEGSVLLAPVLSGSGVRTKILQSFANYVPVITTDFAAEGLSAFPSENPYLITFKDAGSFMKLYEEFTENQDLLRSLSINALAIYNQYFNDDLLVEKRNEIYQSL